MSLVQSAYLHSLLAPRPLDGGNHPLGTLARLFGQGSALRRIVRAAGPECTERLNREPTPLEGEGLIFKETFEEKQSRGISNLRECVT